MRGSRISAAPTVSPRPGRRCSTSGGTPASCRCFTARKAVSGVCSAGLATTALPAASAPAICPVKMASGKVPGRDAGEHAAPAQAELVALAGRALELERRGEAPPRLGRSSSAGNRPPRARRPAHCRASCRPRAPSGPSAPRGRARTDRRRAPGWRRGPRRPRRPSRGRRTCARSAPCRWPADRRCGRCRR